MKICRSSARSTWISANVFSVKNASSTCFDNRIGPSILDFWNEYEIINLIKRK